MPRPYIFTLCSNAGRTITNTEITVTKPCDEEQEEENILVTNKLNDVSKFQFLGEAFFG
jgi:hypothetical protein